MGLKYSYFNFSTFSHYFNQISVPIHTRFLGSDISSLFFRWLQPSIRGTAWHIHHRLSNGNFPICEHWLVPKRWTVTHLPLKKFPHKSGSKFNKLSNLQIFLWILFDVRQCRFYSRRAEKCHQLRHIILFE